MRAPGSADKASSNGWREEVLDVLPGFMKPPARRDDDPHGFASQCFGKSGHMTEGLPLLEDVWVQHPIEVKVDGFLSHDRILRLGLAKRTHQPFLHFSAFGKHL